VYDEQMRNELLLPLLSAFVLMDLFSVDITGWARSPNSDNKTFGDYCGEIFTDQRFFPTSNSVQHSRHQNVSGTEKYTTST